MNFPFRREGKARQREGNNLPNGITSKGVTNDGHAVPGPMLLNRAIRSTNGAPGLFSIRLSPKGNLIPPTDRSTTLPSLLGAES